MSKRPFFLLPLLEKVAAEGGRMRGRVDPGESGRAAGVFIFNTKTTKDTKTTKAPGKLGLFVIFVVFVVRIAALRAMRRRIAIAPFALAALLTACAPHPRVLRVCADPNNLPFSNRAGEGFENKLAELVAKDLKAKVQYVWWAQRRGYVRNTLKDQRCDVWPGVATQVEMLATTRPYYRSTYVFVSRADRKLDIASFDDPRLKTLKIGVQMVGDDAQNTPPAHALARRGIIGNVRGFMLYGDYAKPNPPAEIVQAVDRGDIDVAVVWGPLAGYFASRAGHPLTLTAVQPWLDGPQWPMVFDISMGVRREDAKLKSELDKALERRAAEVKALLAAYHVPIAPDPTAG